MPDGAREAPWGLVGRSAAMETLWKEIETLGPDQDLNIHIYGETGTGKELVARALHEVSGRRGRLVTVNAAGFTDELLAAELFGHARGAFTGAVTGHDGYVAAAEGGTLFLDEIGELTGKGQVKLLRLLDQREYHRLGETAARHADVRVVSATNVDLAQLVAEKRFREDLMYRLLGERIEVPPLRQRGRDAVVLARHFLALERRAGKRAPHLSQEAEGALARYSWPGNVRQLATEVKRFAGKATAGVVHPHHLSPEVREGALLKRSDLRSARDDFERGKVRRALERHGANRTATAAELGMSRQALVSKIRDCGMPVGIFPRAPRGRASPERGRGPAFLVKRPTGG